MVIFSLIRLCNLIEKQIEYSISEKSLLFCKLPSLENESSIQISTPD